MYQTRQYNHGIALSLYKYYTGKDDSLDTSKVGATHAVVLKLLEGLEGRGHHVYTDNYYSSPALFGDLQRLGFGACGTVRKNRRGLPDETTKAKLKKVEVVSKQIDSSMLALKWMDKREVMMLSTIHDDSFVTKKRRSRAATDGHEDILKPLVVEEYNRNMGGCGHRRSTAVVLWIFPPYSQVVEAAVFSPH